MESADTDNWQSIGMIARRVVANVIEQRRKAAALEDQADAAGRTDMSGNRMREFTAANWSPPNAAP